MLTQDAVVLEAHGRERMTARPRLVVSTPAVAMWERSAYSASRRGHPVAVTASIGAVAALLAAITHLNIVTPKAMSRQLKVVELAVEPPPPPPEAPPPPPKLAPEPAKIAIVAPLPVVQVPKPAPQVATVPVAPPPQAVIVAPNPAPAPPKPAAGPADAGDLSSKMISAKPPSYPMESRRNHEQGTVILSVLLGTDGGVSDIAVAQSSGFDRLDKAALAAVRHWRWSPTMRGGEAMMVRGLVRIPFVLKS